jgi:cardiolipin synthase A/B
MFGRFKREWKKFRSGRPGHRFQDRYEQNRKTRSSRPWYLRFLKPAAALLLIAAGLLFVVIPGPGLPLIVIGTGLLADEARPIARAMDWFEIRIRKILAPVSRWRRRKSSNHGSKKKMGKGKTLAVVLTAFITVFLTLVVLNLRSSEKQIRYELTHRFSVEDPQFLRSMNHLLGPGVLDGNRVTALQNGDEIFPAMLEAIKNAQETITFETYIYWSGEIGKAFSDALCERARNGVKVHVLLDWVGTGKIEKEYLDDLKAAGAEVERYHPLHWYSLARINNRTHRKLLVIDGRIGFTGGVGIADEWAGNAESKDHWRDSHYKLEGPAVAQIQAAFTDNWIKTRATVLFGKEYFPELKSVGGTLAQVFKSSQSEGSESVRLMYLLSIASATKTIRLQAAYFVPDGLAVDAFLSAAKRAVKIEIIVPGPYTDAKVVQSASRSRWGELLDSGVKIYEYQPSMYHCKVMIVDDVWVSVGSTNFDDRSFRLNDEANLNIYDSAFAAEQVQEFEKDKGKSREITRADFKERSTAGKIIDELSGLLRRQL